MQAQARKQRIHLLDELRGFAVVCMVFYHAFYSMADIFGMELGRTLLNFFMPAEPFFAGLFILISGIASRLTRSNVKRGAKLLIVAVLLTAATLLLTLFGINQVIWFGILHMLAVSMLAFALLQPLCDKIHPGVGMAVCAVLFLITMHIGEGYLGFSFARLNIPQALIDLPFLFPVGIHNSLFSSADYFPVFPWIFVFFFGAFLGVYARDGKFPKCFYRSHIRAFSVVGRYALPIYIVHQPVIFGVMELISLLA